MKQETKAKVEMLMLTQIEGDDWEVLLKPAKRIKVGQKLSFGEGKIEGFVYQRIRPRRKNYASFI